jgi:hypothetical protein
MSVAKLSLARNNLKPNSPWPGIIKSFPGWKSWFRHPGSGQENRYPFFTVYSRTGYGIPYCKRRKTSIQHRSGCFHMDEPLILINLRWYVSVFMLILYTSLETETLYAAYMNECSLLIVRILLRHCSFLPPLVEERKSSSFMVLTCRQRKTSSSGTGCCTSIAQFHASHLQAKEDEQQRNWMLHEDEPLILRNMEKLCLTLKNANEEIRCTSVYGVGGWEGRSEGAGQAGKDNGRDI